MYILDNVIFGHNLVHWNIV